jgi:heat shock protein HslJ
VKGKPSTALGARPLTVVVAVLVVGGLAAGCVKPRPPAQPSLYGTSWVLVNASLGVPIPSGELVTLRFTGTAGQPSGGVLEATTPCYELRGSFVATTAGRLTISSTPSLTPRERGCVGPMITAHDRFVAGLYAATGYRVVDGELRIPAGLRGPNPAAEEEVRLRFTVAPVAEPRREPSIVPSSWTLIPDSLAPAPVPGGTAITADIRGAVISGSAGCNAYTGPLATSVDGRFAAGPLSSTDRACEPGVGAAEQAFLTRLSAADAYRVEGGELHLLAGSAVTLRFDPTAGAGADRLAGSYRIVGLRAAGTGALAPLVPDSSISLSLGATGVLSGSACNVYGGQWLVDGDRFTVAGLWNHATYCTVPDGVVEQEVRYFAALRAANRWEMQEGDLLLYGDDGVLARAQRA